MKNVTQNTTVIIPLVGYVPVELDVTNLDLNDTCALLEAAKKQLPHLTVEWKLDECSNYDYVS